MGATLEEIYNIVTNKAGYKGRMRLAVKTGISKIKASQMDDSPEIITRLKKAADEIIGQDIDQYFKRR